MFIDYVLKKPVEQRHPGLQALGPLPAQKQGAESDKAWVVYLLIGYSRDAQ